MSNKELRPCPFCNGEVIVKESKSGFSVICCHSCGARTIALYMDDAIKAWNSRSNIETFEKEYQKAIDAYHKAINSYHDVTDQLEESK